MAEGTDFLYPFIEGGERDAGALLVDLASSVEAKVTSSASLRESTLAGLEPGLVDAAQAIADRFHRGGRLFTCGNGGSATDALSLAALFRRPPSGRAVATRCLADDPAVLTALANDVGFDLVFVRQLMAHAAATDVLVAFSTSGDSRNLMAALAHAHRAGLYTVGIAGYEGGEMARLDGVDACFVVRSESVHRIQEVQAAIAWRLWQYVQDRLTREEHGG